MKIKRTVPPAAAPLRGRDLWYGMAGMLGGRRSVKKVEEEIKEYFGVRHVFLVSSGKAALALILLGLRKLSSRREVVIPAYTCYSVPSAVLKAGLKPSLCDIDGQRFDFDVEGLKRTVTNDTLCVVPSHLFGIPSALEEIGALCRERGAYVIEDAAQAMGGSDQGRRLGAIGDVGFFSFGRGKNVTCGSGGAIVTNSKPIADAIAEHYSDLESPGVLESWKEFLEVVLMALFIRPRAYWFPAGLPFLKLGETFYHPDFPMKRLSGMKAGLLRGWRERLEGSNRRRSAAAAAFRERLRLREILPWDIPYLRLPILVDSRETRDRIYALSRERGLGIGLMYPAPIHEIPEIRAAFRDRAYPGAAEIAERLLTLPTHPLISEKDQEAILALFGEAARPEGDRSCAEEGAAVRC